MTEFQLKEKIYKKYGDINYKIISFRVMREPADFLCLDCGKTIHIEHLQNLFRETKKNFCPYCSNTYKGELIGKRLPVAAAQERLDKELGGEYIIIPEKYNGWSRKGLIRHSICNKIFTAAPRDLLYHSHCPCYTINSKGEQKIKEILDQYSIKYEQQKRLNSIKKAPFDFYLPDYNLLIEFQGRQHYEPVEKFGGEKQFLIQQEIDNRKREIAKKEGYQLLEISYLDKSLIKEILVPRLSLTGVELSGSKYQSPQNED